MLRARSCVFCAALAASACGGGGGSGSVPPIEPPATISISQPPPPESQPHDGQILPWTVKVNSSTAAGTTIYVAAQATTNGIASVVGGGGPTPAQIQINFKDPSSLAIGTYNDTLTVRGCYDQACTLQVSNSPQVLPVQYTITAIPPRTGGISPESAVQGGPGFTLTVLGTMGNFDSQCVVQWNGAALPTTLVSATQLTAQVSAADLATAGTVAVTVTDQSNGTGSVPLDFTVQALAALTTTRLAPASVTVGNVAFVLTVLGTGLTQSSIVEWNGSPRTTTFVSDTELLAQIDAADVAAIGTAEVVVQNLPTQGGASAPLPITIVAPSIDAVSVQINRAHTGTVTFNNVSLPGSAKWSVDLGAMPSTAPVIADGKVLVATYTLGPHGSVDATAQFFVLDQATGATLWGPLSYTGVHVFPTYDAGKVFLNAGLLIAFDATTGSVLWEAYGGNIPVATDGFIYAGTGAYDESNGNSAWLRASGSTLSADGLYDVNPCNALRPATGEPLWNLLNCPIATTEGLPVVANGVLYAFDAQPGREGGHTYDAETGQVLGTFLADTTPAIGPDTGYFLQSQILRAIRLSDNAVLWSFAGDGQLITAPIVVNQYVFIGSSTGVVFGLDAATGAQLWQSQIVSGPTSIPGLAAGDGLLVVPAGTSVTAFTLSTNP